MSTVTASRIDPRPLLRRPDDALPRASIGTAPMLWANADGAPRDGSDSMAILDEIARVGYEGTQLGDGFPEGAALRDALRDRGLRLAEVYVPIPATVDGPVADALAIAEERLRLLHDGEGDVLCLAIDGSADRDAAAGRASEPGTPVLTDAGWDSLVELIHAIADRATALGHPVAFHPHGGTFIETPAEVERLAAATDPDRMGICLDVGHYLVGGGDPVTAIRALGDAGHARPPQGCRPGGPHPAAGRRARGTRARDPASASSPSSGPGCSTSTASSPRSRSWTTPAG